MYAIDFTDGLYQLCFVGFVDGIPAGYIVEAFTGLYGNGCKGISAQVVIIQVHRGEGGKGDEDGYDKLFHFLHLLTVVFCYCIA